MASKVVLHVIPPADGGHFVRTDTAEKMQGRGYIPLPALGIEAVADVEQQIMGLFSYITASEMTLAIRMADVDYPVKKSLSTILEAARADNPELVELDRNSRSLPVYVNLAPLFNAKGESCHPY